MTLKIEIGRHDHGDMAWGTSRYETLTVKVAGNVWRDYAARLARHDDGTYSATAGGEDDVVVETARYQYGLSALAELVARLTA